MNWFNLKQNRCPKCGRELDGIEMVEIIRCSGNTELKHDCDFRIRESRMEEVIAKLNKQSSKIYKPEHESNEDALNSM